MSAELHIDVDDHGLQHALELAPEHLAKGLLHAVDDSAAALQRDWRSGARKTARRHGKRYPSSITRDVTIQSGAVTSDIGPDSAMPQGGMGRGFEYGSVHQPPHMDGAVAFARNTGKFEAAVSDAIAKVVDSL